MEIQDADLVKYIDFLDGARLVPSVQQQKRIIFELLALRAGEKVLDIGCGTGDDVRDIAHLVGPRGKCVGVDLEVALIDVARRRSMGKKQPVEFDQGDIYTLRFPDSTFDVTRAERLFEHLRRPERALAEMIRVTKVGGRILVASPDMDTNLIDHSDRSVTRRIRHFESDRRPNGSAGHKLYGLFWDAGLTDLQVLAVVHINIGYEEVLGFLDLGARAEAARDAGTISESDCTSWLEQLHLAGQAGRFFMSTNHYIVYGRKA